MLKNFIKNISIYGILPIVGKFMNFVLVPIYAKTFAPEEYGIVDLFDAFVFFLLVVASFEIPTAMGRFFYDEDNMEHRRKIVNTSLILTLLIVLATVFVAFVFKRPALEKLLGGQGNDYLFPAAMVWLFTLALNTFLSFIPRYDNRPKVYVAVGVVSIAIKLVFSILFIVILQTGLIGVFYGYICGNAASVLLYILVSRHYFGFVFSLKYAGKMLVYALPLLLGSLMVDIWKPWLRHLITQYYPVAVVGLYAFAIRLTSVNMIVHGAFKTAWKPLLFEKKEEFIKGNSMRRISGLVAIASILMGCIIACYAKEATIIIGSSNYLDSVQLTGLLALSGIIQMMCELRGFGPYIADKTYIVTIANICSIVAASAFLILVKDSMGVYGIGYACIIYDLICYLILVTYTWFSYRISLHNYWEIPLVAILCVCVWLSVSAAQLRFRTLAAVIAFLLATWLFYSKYYKTTLKRNDAK